MIVHKLKGKTWETVYAHMKSGSRKVKEGDTVKQGQAIGVMGSTGNVTGQHLHFELHEGRWNINKSNAVDPLKYLSDSVQMKEEKTLLYTVKGGDTLSQIAKDHNTTVAALVRINNIKDKNIIMPGQRLKLSGKKSGGTYTVKKGDNLSVIAKNNKTTVNAIVKLNNIKDKNLIRIGDKLALP